MGRRGSGGGRGVFAWAPTVVERRWRIAGLRGGGVCAEVCVGVACHAGLSLGGCAVRLWGGFGCGAEFGLICAVSCSCVYRWLEITRIWEGPATPLALHNGGIPTIVGLLLGGLIAVCISGGTHNCKICLRESPKAGVLSWNESARFAVILVFVDSSGDTAIGEPLF